MVFKDNVEIGHKQIVFVTLRTTHLQHFGDLLVNLEASRNFFINLVHNSIDLLNSTAKCPVRPPQTAIGRPAGTLLGSAPVPVAVFGVAPNPFPKRNGITSSLIPAFSPRRRRIVRRLFEKRAPELAGLSSAKPESSNGDFLSPGERIKGEGERQYELKPYKWLKTSHLERCAWPAEGNPRPPLRATELPERIT